MKQDSAALSLHKPVMNNGSKLLRTLKNEKGLVFGLGLLLIVILFGVIGPFLVQDPQLIKVSDRLKPPAFMAGGTMEHLLGTDQLGRDMLSRLVYGMHNSAIISIAAVIVSVLLGSIIGLCSGYFGKYVDTILMRLTDIQLAFPFIILSVAVLSLTRPTILNITIVLAIVNWPTYARVIRSMVLSEKEKDYVRAAQILGASGKRIISKYIAPNLIPNVIAISTLDIATMVISEAVLGFLGLGIQPPDPSWGNIMADGRQYIETAWWITTLPGVFIFIAVFGISLIGEQMASKFSNRG
jgi:peptide/nickel transport system permease protein